MHNWTLRNKVVEETNIFQEIKKIAGIKEETILRKGYKQIEFLNKKEVDRIQERRKKQ